jgi:hypothetical protein
MSPSEFAVSRCSVDASSTVITRHFGLNVAPPFIRPQLWFISQVAGSGDVHSHDSIRVSPERIPVPPTKDDA